MAPSLKQALLLSMIVSLSVSDVLAHRPATDLQNLKELQNFFRKIDSDGDGEIAQDEANNYMELNGVESEGYTTVGGGAVVESVHQVEQTFSYGGTTISSAELTTHLQHMLTGEHVADWITHGVRLPQYTAAFLENSIDGQDFPALLSDNQTALRDDLGVQSPLHRTKIHTAIFRQVFGIGRVPGVPHLLECKATPCGSLQLQWDPPANAGVPPVHKYLVQRKLMHTRAALWVPVGDPTDDSLLDMGVAAGVAYRYRVQAWGGHGPSDWVEVDGCGTDVEYDDQCSTEGWDYAAAKAGWRGAGGMGGVNRWGPQGGEGEGGSEGEGQPFVLRFLIAAGVVLFGVAVRNTLFWDVLIRVMERSRDVSVQNVLERRRALKSSTFLGARLLSFSLDVLFWLWHATAVRGVWLIWRVIVGLHQETDSTPHADLVAEVGSNGEGGGSRRGLVGESGVDSVGAATERQVACSDGSPLIQEGSGGNVERATDMRYCKSETDLSRTSSSTMVGSWEESSDASVPRGSRRSMSSDNVAAAGDGGVAGRGVGVREGGSGVSCQSEDGEGEEDGEMEEEDLREAELMKGKGRCNAKGCDLRFDRWRSLRDWANSRSMHFCKGCQGAFCSSHTRYANHEGLGGCAIHTQCLCFPCFYQYPIPAQKGFDQLNRLKGRRTTAATSLPGGTSRRDTSPLGSGERLEGEGGGGGGGSGGGGGGLKLLSRPKTRGTSKSSADSSPSRSSDADSADEPSPRTPSKLQRGLGSGGWSRRRGGGKEGLVTAVDKRVEMEEERAQKRLSTSAPSTSNARRGGPAGTLAMLDGSKSEGFDGPFARGSGRRGQPSLMPAENEARLGDRSSSTGSTNPQKTLELRWRMSLMWALEHRGAADSAGAGLTSPQPRQELGGLGAGAGGREWGKSKPPRPPTDAQKRWLKAGRWALGKELESHELEGGGLQRVVLRSASDLTANLKAEAPSPPGGAEQPSGKKKVVKRFWRNLTA